MNKITFNGKEYASFDDLPQEAREVLKMTSAFNDGKFGDANNNGVPDILEGDAASTRVEISHSTNIDASGDFSIDKLPPEMQRMIRRETGWMSGGSTDDMPPTKTSPTRTTNSLSGPGIDPMYSGAQQTTKRSGFVWLLVGFLLGGVAVAIAVNL